MRELQGRTVALVAKGEEKGGPRDTKGTPRVGALRVWPGDGTCGARPACSRRALLHIAFRITASNRITERQAASDAQVHAEVWPEVLGALRRAHIVGRSCKNGDPRPLSQIRLTQLGWWRSTGLFGLGWAELAPIQESRADTEITRSTTLSR